MKNLNNFIQKNRLMCSVIIFIIIFLLINLIRLASNNSFPSQQSTIFVNDFQEYKSFSYEGTNLYYEAIIELSFIFNETLSILIINLLLSIVSIIIFNRLLELFIKRD